MNPVVTVPKDGTLVRLFVDYSADEAHGALEDAEQAWTIGFNQLADTGEDHWQFAGWDWSHDCFTEGSGEILGWLPFDHGDTKDWRDDPSLDERWNAGLGYGMDQLCKLLDVDPKTVTWDAATETLHGDVQAVLGNILTKAMGENWRVDRVERPIHVNLSVTDAEHFLNEILPDDLRKIIEKALKGEQ